MMKDLFKPEDFEVYSTEMTQGLDPLKPAERLARVANEKINKALESATVVYGYKGYCGTWQEQSNGGEISQALLIGVRPIKQKTTLEKISDLIETWYADKSHMISSVATIDNIKKLIEAEHEKIK